jgi:hypothetical protein
MLGAALAMTVAYTGSIASAAAGEGERMHALLRFCLSPDAAQ